MGGPRARWRQLVAGEAWRLVLDGDGDAEAPLAAGAQAAVEEPLNES